jgi:hypothetical protein
MSFLRKIEGIKDKLSLAGYPNFVTEILDLQLSGGTGGEVLISVCSKLIEIKHTNRDAYLIIEDESDDLINYCKSLGMYPKQMGVD